MEVALRMRSYSGLVVTGIVFVSMAATFRHPASGAAFHPPTGLWVYFIGVRVFLVLLEGAFLTPRLRKPTAAAFFEPGFEKKAVLYAMWNNIFGHLFVTGIILTFAHYESLGIELSRKGKLALLTASLYEVFILYVATVLTESHELVTEKPGAQREPGPVELAAPTASASAPLDAPAPQDPMAEEVEPASEA